MELGPGLGALTRSLAELYPTNLLAVDVDPRAVAVLQKDLPNLKVRLQDLLTLNHAEAELFGIFGVVLQVTPCINPNDELIQDGFLTAHLPRQCWVLQWRKHAKTIMVYTGAICLIRPLQLVGFLIDLHIDMFDI